MRSAAKPPCAADAFVDAGSQRSLNHNKADNYNGKTPNRSTSRSNHKRVQPFTIEEIESMNATDTMVGESNNGMEEVETLSFEERLKRVGAKKVSPLNVNAMTTNNFTSNIADDDEFSPIYLVGNKKSRTSDIENDSIGFKLQSIDPLMLQRRSSSSNSSSNTRYSQNR